MTFYEIDRETSREITLAKYVDGYAFEGSDWNMFSRLIFPLELKGLDTPSVYSINSDFMKSRPELSDWTSIMIPLWITLQPPGPVYICWRGKLKSKAGSSLKTGNDRDDASYTEESEKELTNYGKIRSNIRELFVESIEKLDYGSKTRNHYEVTFDAPNHLRVMSQEDFEKMTPFCNAKNILAKLRDAKLEEQFFDGNSQVVFICCKLGESQEIHNNKKSFKDFFWTISLANCSYKLVHTAFNWTTKSDEKKPRVQTFFLPSEIEKRVGDYCKKYLLNFAEDNPNNNLIGNLQCNKITPNEQNVRSINVYKFNTVNQVMKQDKTLRFSSAGISSYIDTWLRSRVEANCQRSNVWKINETPPAAKGSQKELLESKESPLKFKREEMEQIWDRNRPLRFEMAVLIMDTKDADPLEDSFKRAEEWLRNKELFKIEEISVHVRSVAEEKGGIGVEKIAQKMNSAYYQATNELVEIGRSAHKYGNLLQRKIGNNIIHLKRELYRCIAAECLTFDFLCGDLPQNKKATAIKDYLQSLKTNNPLNDYSGDSTQNKIFIDPKKLKLLEILRNKNIHDEDKLCKDLIPNDHWTCTRSTVRFLNLKERWDQLVLNGVPSLPLNNFFEAFISFSTLSEWHTNGGPEQFGVLSDQNHLETVVEEANELRKGRTLLTTYHSVDWYLQVLKRSVGVLPVPSSIWIYKYCLAEWKNDKTWETQLNQTLTGVIRKAKSPIAIGFRNPHWDLKTIESNLYFECSLQQVQTLPEATTNFPSGNRPKPKKRPLKEIKQDSINTGVMFIVPTFKDFDGKSGYKEEDYIQIMFKSVTLCLDQQRSTSFEQFEHKFKQLFNEYKPLFTAGKSLTLVLELLRISNCNKEGNTENYETKFSEMWKLLRSNTSENYNEESWGKLQLLIKSFGV